MSWGDGATWAAAAVAVGAAIWSGLQARTSNRAAVDSADSADRSAAAAERSAAADERAVALAEAQAAKYVPRWRFEHQKEDFWALVNDSDETAYGVTVVAPGLEARIEPAPKDLHPGSALTFLAMRHSGTTDDTVTVTWRRSSDPAAVPQQPWSRSLPHAPGK